MIIQRFPGLVGSDMYDLFVFLSRTNRLKFSGSGLILVLFSIFYGSAAWTQTYAKTYEVVAQEQRFHVVVANNEQARRRGLMGMGRLQPNQGLLMVMPGAQSVGVWMKNMQIALDVVWISGSGEVLDIMTLGPCIKDPCATYRSNRPASYVLEVGAGLFPSKVGDRVEILDASRDSLFPPATDGKAAD